MIDNAYSNTEFKKLFKERMYRFSLQIIELIDTLNNDKVSLRLGDQLLRSGTSAIANYVEGQSSSTSKELINYLNISLKSANETKLWLSLLKDSKRIQLEKYEVLINKVSEFAKILAASIITLKNKKGIPKVK